MIKILAANKLDENFENIWRWNLPIKSTHFKNFLQVTYNFNFTHAHIKEKDTSEEKTTEELLISVFK